MADYKPEDIKRLEPSDSSLEADLDELKILTEDKESYIKQGGLDPKYVFSADNANEIKNKHNALVDYTTGFPTEEQIQAISDKVIASIGTTLNDLQWVNLKATTIAELFEEVKNYSKFKWKKLTTINDSDYIFGNVEGYIYFENRYPGLEGVGLFSYMYQNEQEDRYDTFLIEISNSDLFMTVNDIVINDDGTITKKGKNINITLTELISSIVVKK